jgi:benzoyl-CoA-dihydrodiol lyase
MMHALNSTNPFFSPTGDLTMSSSPRVNYQTDPSQYKHWKLSFDGAVATLKADFDENAGLRPGYKLKLNSYDLGVDIELNDAINRVRFEHPEVRTVVVTSAKDKVFCSGANIFMLGVSRPGRLLHPQRLEVFGGREWRLRGRRL